LRIVKLSHSSYYEAINREVIKKPHCGGRPIPGYTHDHDGNMICDDTVKGILKVIIETEGFYYGYHKLAICLKKRHRLIINKKKVYRLCKELNMLRPQRKLKKSHPRRLARNRVVTGPNQLWESDLKYGYIAGENRFFYVATILDVFDREAISYHVGLSCTSKDISIALADAVMCREGVKPVIRTDNGSQFIGFHFESSCLAMGIEHERIPYRTPNKIAHIESFHNILEEECLCQVFENYAQAYSTVVTFMKFYNSKRIHGSLGFMSPKEYGKCYKNVKSKEIRV
jgi:putative transposase